jgi:molybdopterin synthase sulfur carrier subunit
MSRTIRLVYLARLREAFATPGESLDLPDDVRDVGGLTAHLARRGGAWATELAGGRALRIAVNHEVARPDTRVDEGDEVALFPPVTGG